MSAQAVAAHCHTPTCWNAYFADKRPGTWGDAYYSGSLDHGHCETCHATVAIYVDEGASESTGAYFYANSAEPVEIDGDVRCTECRAKWLASA